MNKYVFLRDVLEIQNGFAFDSSLFNTSKSGLPIIRIRDLSKGFSDTYYNGGYEKKYIVKKGDFLIGMDGEFRCYQWKSEEALLNQRVCKLHNFSKDMNPKYLYYLINKYLIEIENKTSYVTVKHISSKQIYDIKVPLPSLSEQERIVKLLDEAEALRTLRASTRMADFVPALFEEMFGNPETNPKKWDTYKIKELLVANPNYGTMIPAKAAEGAWLTLRVANIQNGRLNLEDQKYVDLPTEAIERHSVQDGDLLLARAIGSREHLGKCIVVYPGKKNHWAFDSHLMRVRPNQEKVIPIFLHSFLTSPSGREIFLKSTRQSAVQFNINTKEFSNIQIFLPPLSLQKEFANKLDEGHAIQQLQTQSEERIEALYQSMLSRAFTGQL